MQTGYAYVPAPDWEIDPACSPAVLQRLYAHLPEDGYSDGNRERAHAVLVWDRAEQSLGRDRRVTTYEQPLAFNATDGGKVRHFAPILDEVLQDRFLRQLLMRDLWFAESSGEFTIDAKVQVDLHAIRYRARPLAPASSSPPWVHRDNEPLVLVHLVHRDPWLAGGDNIIAKTTKAESPGYSDVVPLLQPLDTLALANNVPHAVTPIGVLPGVDDDAVRDVLLVTFKHFADVEAAA